MLQKYIVSGFNGLRIYCKETSTPVYNSEEKNHTISFGGKSNFCFTAIILATNPASCYIDRVEYNAACAVDGSLREKGNTVQLVQLALWTIVSKFPNVERFTLFDDSYLDCTEGSKLDKLSLSHDYVLKYNQTWYQRNFSAELDTSHATEFTTSLKVLDQPLEPFDNVVLHRDSLKPFRGEYNHANTPREFMNALRGPDYCFKVGKWIEQYMKYLGVSMFKEGWFIRREAVGTPPNYSIEETHNTLRGGFTRKTKRRNFSLRPHNSAGGYNN
jgi:hypothetical protein